ncbi:PQ loop repeat protein-like protein [Westerdykella ornata]|uniref:PQ loop repeat protein-like protein n=1 Tax=Westerdykella ornata TaxID=318751 RepID=A0A6A6JD17_WESOR|nr:PQ loop repeat protein-like protein [Westerdykella ornata]KAF2273516.1 PQ loop repeat protein-like protein [Westerdykella ornata]
MSPRLSDRCRELSHPDVFQFSVSVFIVFGILVSYLPQHWKIIHRRSSAGLSPLFVLLGTISGTASIANILTLPESTRDMGCCKQIGAFPCAAALLGIVQIGVQWTCFFFIMLLFLIFFPRNAQETAEDEVGLPTWKEAILVLSLSLLFFLFAFFGSVIFAYGLPEHIRGWANFLGVTGSILAGIQYVPQIITTWQRQTIGSLSVLMMCIQTPGSFVFAASLAARLGPGGWSSWSLFILTGCLQGCLLAMCLWFMWRDRGSKKTAGADDIGNGDEGDRSERTPLLGNEVTRGA